MIEFAREGADFDLVLARELHKMPEEIRAMPNTEYLGFLALLRLESERSHHAAVHSRNRPTKKRR